MTKPARPLRDQFRSTVSRWTRTPTAERVTRRAVAAATAADRRAPRSLAILTYHRVAPADASPTLSPTMVNAAPRGFSEQLAVVRDVGNPVSLPQVRAAIEERADLPPRAVLVTFDDAYADFADHAWPLLRQQGIPAVMFVPTAYPGDPDRSFWWDRLWCALSQGPRACDVASFGLTGSADAVTTMKQLRDLLLTMPHDEAMDAVDRIVAHCGGPTPRGTVLTWEQLHRLADEGLAIAPHSHTHPRLTKVPAERAAEEIRRSIDELRRRGLGDPAVFAYPGGDHDSAVHRQVRAAGCTIAMTTERGVNRLDAADPLALRRINVGQLTTPAMLAAQLAPSLARLDRWAGP